MCIAKRNESQVQADKLLKVSSTEGRYPWSVVLATLHDLHLQTTKVQKTSSHKAVSNRFFMQPKCRKWAITKPDTLGAWVWRPYTNSISRRQSAEYEFTRSQVPWRREFQDSPNILFQAFKMLKINHKEILNRGFHDLAEIAFSYHQNAKNDLARNYVPCLAPWFSRLG